MLIQPRHVEALVSRAGILFDVGRFDAADADVRKIREYSTRDPRGAYLAALLAERAGKPEEAQAALRDVTALLDPIPFDFIRQQPQLLMLGGLAHFGLREFEKARPYLDSSLKRQPGSPAAKVLAQVYLAQKNVDGAVEVLEPYVKAQPDDVQALMMLASAHLAKDRHARATALMQDALTRKDLPALHGMLGLSWIGAGKFTDAASELEAAYQRDPDQAYAGALAAAIYLQGGQERRALTLAESMAKRQPGNASVLNLLGTARARINDLAGARKAFEAALKLDPGLLAVQVSLARLDTQTKAYDAAIKTLTAVLAKDPRHVEALYELARVLARKGEPAQARRTLGKAEDLSGPENLQPGFALVDFHLSRGEVDLAREAVKRLTAKAADSVPVLLAAARIDLAAGDAVGARTTLTRASGLAGFDAVALVQVALLQLAAQHVPGAAHTLDKALDSSPNLLLAQALMAEVEIRQGELGKAEQRARQIVAKQPKAGVGHGLLGDVAWARNQRPAAVEAYRRAHQLDPSSDSLARLFRAVAASDKAAAVAIAEGWLKSRPADTVVRRMLADAHASSGDLVAARRAYESLVDVAPDDGAALNNLANVLVLLKDPGALRVAERALAVSPGDANVIGTAGWAAFKAGQTDRALQLLRGARLRNPNNADTRHFLGAVLANQGKSAEARQELQVALQSGALSYPVQARDLLATLK